MDTFTTDGVISRSEWLAFFARVAVGAKGAADFEVNAAPRPPAAAPQRCARSPPPESKQRRACPPPPQPKQRRAAAPRVRPPPRDGPVGARTRVGCWRRMLPPGRSSRATRASCRNLPRSHGAAAAPHPQRDVPSHYDVPPRVSKLLPSYRSAPPRAVRSRDVHAVGRLAPALSFVPTVRRLGSNSAFVLGSNLSPRVVLGSSPRFEFAFRAWFEFVASGRVPFVASVLEFAFRALSPAAHTEDREADPQDERAQRVRARGREDQARDRRAAARGGGGRRARRGGRWGGRAGRRRWRRRRGGGVVAACADRRGAQARRRGRDDGRRGGRRGERPDRRRGRGQAADDREVPRLSLLAIVSSSRRGAVSIVPTHKSYRRARDVWWCSSFRVCLASLSHAPPPQMQRLTSVFWWNSTRAHGCTTPPSRRAPLAARPSAWHSLSSLPGARSSLNVTKMVGTGSGEHAGLLKPMGSAAIPEARVCRSSLFESPTAHPPRHAKRTRARACRPIGACLAPRMKGGRAVRILPVSNRVFGARASSVDGDPTITAATNPCSPKYQTPCESLRSPCARPPRPPGGASGRRVSGHRAPVLRERARGGRDDPVSSIVKLLCGRDRAHVARQPRRRRPPRAAIEPAIRSADFLVRPPRPVAHAPSSILCHRRVFGGAGRSPSAGIRKGRRCTTCTASSRPAPTAPLPTVMPPTAPRAAPRRQPSKDRTDRRRGARSWRSGDALASCALHNWSRYHNCAASSENDERARSSSDARPRWWQRVLWQATQPRNTRGLV